MNASFGETSWRTLPLWPGTWILHLHIPVPPDSFSIKATIKNCANDSVLWRFNDFIPQQGGVIQRYLFITLKETTELELSSDGLAVPGANVKYLRVTQ